MTRHGTQRVLKKVRDFTPIDELESLRRAFTELDGRQRLLHRIGQHLTGLPDRETLVRVASSYLCRDLPFNRGRVVLRDGGPLATSKSPALFPSDVPTPLMLPVIVEDEVVADIVIPHKENQQRSDLDDETLKTFAAFVGVAITNIRRFEKVRALASIDPLTGVMNRRRFFEIGSQQIMRARWNGIIVFDVDRLKRINDTLGHLAGDALLKSIAKRAESCVRKTDFLARYGGDEFVILLPNTALEAVQKVADRLRKYIETTSMEWMGRSVHSTISLGLASLQSDVDIQSLFARADESLYEAKNAGRNSVRP
jgi:diguanylate cyclase (GGDEF)-like protein